MDLEEAAAPLLIIGLVIGFFVLVFVWVIHVNEGRMAQCKDTYGEQWYYVDGDRGASFCANPNGEVRYPQSWN